MVIYECERCGYKVKHKHNFLKHLNRKISCKPILSNIRFDSLKKEFNKKNIKMSTKCKHNVNIMSTKCKHNVNINDKINNKELNKLYSCNFCNKKYSKNSNLRRHENKCKAKKQKSLLEYMSQQIIEIKTEHEKERQQHEKEKAELRLHIEKLLEKVGNNNNNIENQQINIININSYGKENLDYLSKEE